MTRKITFTQAQKLQPIGLQTVGRGIVKQMEAIEAAATEITGEKPSGHTSDFLWGESTVDVLIDRLSGPHVEFADKVEDHPETTKPPRAGEPGGAST